MKLKLFLLALTLSTSAMAAEYKIDTKGMHASVQFKISHLGTSWLWGRFDKFYGSFSYDKDHPNDSKFRMTVDTNSIDTNHAERDKHLRKKKGSLETDKFSQASFVSSSVNFNKDGSGTITGTLNLHGVDKTITMAIKKVGEGVDPWGGYRAGFEGHMILTLADFGITMKLGKASETLDLYVAIEGIKQHKK